MTTPYLNHEAVKDLYARYYDRGSTPPPEAVREAHAAAGFPGTDWDHPAVLALVRAGLAPARDGGPTRPSDDDVSAAYRAAGFPEARLRACFERRRRWEALPQPAGLLADQKKPTGRGAAGAAAGGAAGAGAGAPASAPAEAVRAKARSRLRGALGAGHETAALDIERCAWNRTLRACANDGIPLYWDDARLRKRYVDRVRSLDFNLRQAANPELLRRVRAGEVTAKRLVHMTPEEMWPEPWERARERAAHARLRREITVDAASAPDGAYTCGRCKSRKTTYISLQIRSADEPMTNFVRCLACQKSWKD